jgi:hypothetical protein
VYMEGWDMDGLLKKGDWEPARGDYFAR